MTRINLLYRQTGSRVVGLETQGKTFLSGLGHELAKIGSRPIVRRGTNTVFEVVTATPSGPLCTTQVVMREKEKERENERERRESVCV
jgi:hypothetical protein